MAENTVSWMILTQIWPPKFFVGFTPTRCYALFQAIIVCKAKANESNLRKANEKSEKSKEKLRNQTWENGQKN